MFLEQFIAWQQQQPEDAQFKQFAHQWIEEEFINQSHPCNLMVEIMYQIYLLQCCIEGLIEDMEYSHEEIEKGKKSKKSNGRVERRKTA